MPVDPWYDWIDLAKQLARDTRQPDFQHQVVALLISRKRPVGYGINQRRHARGMSVFKDSLHAEADLVRRYGNALEGAKVYLYRFNTAAGSPFVDQVLC